MLPANKPSGERNVNDHQSGQRQGIVRHDSTPHMKQTQADAPHHQGCHLVDKNSKQSAMAGTNC